MRFLKPIFVAVALFGALSFSPEAAAQRGGRNAQSASVIVLDYARIVEASDIGRDMTTKLNQIAQQMQAELQPDGAAIAAEQQSIQQATQGMTAEQARANRALSARVEAFTQRVEQFRARQAGMARDFDYTRQFTINDFNTQITPIVREVTEARGAGVVLDRSAVQFSQPAFDATDDVVQRLNQRLRTINVARQAAPAPQPPPAQQ